MCSCSVVNIVRNNQSSSVQLPKYGSYLESKHLLSNDAWISKSGLYGNKGEIRVTLYLFLSWNGHYRKSLRKLSVYISVTP